MGAYFTLESCSAAKRLTFGELQTRLIQTLRLKLNNGEFTERGLARISGISQPQVHNLLKGARRLSPESADILLEAVQLSVLDLLTDSDLKDRAQGKEISKPFFPGPAFGLKPQQLPLLLDSERRPRKNPASSLPVRLTLTEQAS